MPSSRARRPLTLALVVTALLGGSCARHHDSWHDLATAERQLVEEIFAAEDRRVTDDEAFATFRRGLASSRTEIRRLAVRSLGRLESPDLSGEIAKVLREEPSAQVRAEAANALAQAVFDAGTEAARVVAGSLLASLAEEGEPAVRGAIAQSLGRLHLPRELLSEVETTLLQVAEEESAAAVLGAARGFESLTRRQPDLLLSEASHERLAELALGGEVSPPPAAASELTAARIRRLAVAALTAAEGASLELLEQALADADREVRRLAVSGLADHADAISAARIEEIARDPDLAVRYQALGSLAAKTEPTAACGLAVSAFADDDPHVALLGIDLAGASCAPGKRALVELLRGLITALGPGETGAWHRAAHSLLALARLSPEAAAELLPGLAQHPVWQVRMYAVPAAVRLGDREQLLRLGDDPMPNVAEAALSGLVGISDREAEAVALAALERDDYQLLLTAARSLEGSGRPETLDALFATLERVTAQQRETSRDIRSELLQRIAELGDSGDAERLGPFLRDFDPRIARQAASALEAWTGEPTSADPQPLPRAPRPSYDDLLALAESRVFVDLEIGTVELRLQPFDAPTNAARFARLAEQGYYDGLTFHRMVPNFVIQGGSPGANEYMGDGPFTRDEPTARSHLRGTVGLSTRGRDTGDAQIFVNLVDNVRLDHNYTIFAEVVAGMEVVDRVLEGAVIETVRLDRLP